MRYANSVLPGYEANLMAYIDSVPGAARILLSDPVGSGRSYSVAGIARDLFDISTNPFNCMVITPWSRVLLEHWRTLLEGFGLPDVKLFDPGDPDTQKLSAGGIFVTMPDVLLKLRDDFWNTKWGLVVFDDPDGWLSESRLQAEARRIWEVSTNVSVAIALSPTVRQGNWLVTHPNTKIVRRQHGKLSGDPQPALLGKDPVTQQSQLVPALQVLRDYFDTTAESSDRAAAQKLYSFIADISPKKWVTKEAPTPIWSQLVQFLLAIGEVYAIATRRPEDKDAISIRLPSGEDLATLFGVNRMTIRKAFDELRKGGFLEGNQGGTYLKVGALATQVLKIPSIDEQSIYLEKTMLNWLVDRGSIGDSDLIIKALGEARDRLESLIGDPASEVRTQPKEPSAVQKFQDLLSRYGLESRGSHLCEAIQSSLFSNGRGAVDLSQREASVLRQLDVGWPALTEFGRQIGRELMDSLMEAKSSDLQDALALVPPKIVALFLDRGQEDEDGYSLRIPVESETWRTDERSYPTSFEQMVFCQKVHKCVVDFGIKLLQLGLAHRHGGPAYRGAKWNAIFFYLPAGAADSIRRWLDHRDASLEYTKQMLDELSLLMREPVPSLQEFNLAGISTERLITYLGTAEDRGIVTKVVEEGPAFIVLDPKAFNQIVAVPALDDVVDGLIDFPAN